MRLPRLLSVGAAVLVLAVPAAVEAQQALPPTYSDSQAVRGRQWFESVCQACHEIKDMTSPDFKVKWAGRTAFDLFEIISTTMPEEEPGTLTQRTYVDIVAYLMQLNGIPAGTTALSAEQSALSSARLTFAPHATPSASPHFRLRR
jgi:mono/diheme cytochrome c family protein